MEEVNRCQIQEWYPKFELVSIRTLILEIPETFVWYLKEESGPLILPQSIFGEDALPRRVRNPEEDFNVHACSDDDSERTHSPRSFSKFELQTKESIKSLGGAVFPKLNWSAPKDSAWISTTGNLRCSTFSEIALLLRSSESLVHDLCHAFDGCTDKTSSRPPAFFLALREWDPFFPRGMEFRCFVRNQLLIGISQRDVTKYYPVLWERKCDLELLLQEFFTENVRQKFESENYVFDVYVSSGSQVRLVDFSPWGNTTSPLLFTWEELQEGCGGERVKFKLVER